MSAKPEPWRSLSAEIRRIKEQLRRLGNASPFFGTGMHPNGDGGIDSDNFVAGTAGYSFAADGNAEFNDLTLRGGIIGNDALANPVKADQRFQGTSGFGLSVAGSYIITINITTPAGFTTCIVTAFGRVLGQNSTASDDSLYTDIDVNGAGGNQFPTGVGTGTGNTSSVGFTTTVTGLSGGDTVSTKLFASTGFASWAASGANAADLSVSYQWTR